MPLIFERSAHRRQGETRGNLPWLASLLVYFVSQWMCCTLHAEARRCARFLVPCLYLQERVNAQNSSRNITSNGPAVLCHADALVHAWVQNVDGSLKASLVSLVGGSIYHCSVLDLRLKIWSTTHCQCISKNTNART